MQLVPSKVKGGRSQNPKPFYESASHLEEPHRHPLDLCPIYLITENYRIRGWAVT